MQAAKPFSFRCSNSIRNCLVAFANFFRALTRRLPQLVSQDAHFRHVLPNPFGFRVGPRDPLSRRWVLDESLPIPDQHADVEFIVEDAGLARRMSSYGRIGPLFAEWAGDVIVI